MKREVEHELLTRWLSETPTVGLRHVKHMIATNSARLIHGAFADTRGGGCLATWFARHHPGLRDSPDPGPAFLRLVGLPLVSHVVNEWDSNAEFPAQFLRAIRRELRYRKGGGRWTGHSVPAKQSAS